MQNSKHPPIATVIIFLLTIGPVAQADVHLPGIFGDHMVLQQETKVPIWGTADAGEKVTVTVADHTATATAGANGKWRVDLAPFPNGTAATTMTVTGKNALTFQDVLIGDVWLASGQSNMWCPLSYAYNGKEESSKAKDTQLRLFLVARKTSLQPLSEVFSPFTWRPTTATSGRPRESDGDQPGTWLVCTPKSASEFSAVAYFFGKELRSHLNRPIGLIGDYWPGCVAQAWVSLSGLQKDPPFTTYVEAYNHNLAEFPKLNPEYEKALAVFEVARKDYETKVDQAFDQFQAAQKAYKDAQKAGTEPLPSPPPDRPTLPVPPKAPPSPDGGYGGPTNLFNGMLAPVIPYAIKGVLWYQGESNTGRSALEYRILFPRLIADWRAMWGQGDFPFIFAQISHFAYAKDGSCALIREAQTRALSIPNTGMAVTVDIPCDDASHPRDKEDPGKRLALAARHAAYGESLVYSGPIYKEMKIESNAIRISFTQIGGGLIIGQTPYQPATLGSKHLTPLPTDKLVGFAIAGEDRKFVPADAKIDGDAVVVSSPDVPQPAAVRFAWGDVVDDNLYNKEQLPASPFRTDEWNDFKFTELPAGFVPPSFPPETFLSPSAPTTAPSCPKDSK